MSNAPSWLGVLIDLAIVLCAENKTDWTQRGTDSQLTYRIRDIDDWKRDLLTALRNVEAEITKVIPCV